MSVIFFGASELGFKCCSSIIESGIEVKSIFTIPEKFEIKYKDWKEKQTVKNVLYRDFSDFSSNYRIPVNFVQNNLLEFKEQLLLLKPKLFIIIGWYYMIPKEILSIPELGTIAIHASLLPKYRGNAPLVWAIINGEKQTGVSLFYIADGIDNGDIIDQEVFTIEDNDTIQDLLVKSELASIKMLSINVSKVLNKTAVRMPQNHDNATYFPKRSPSDGEINWDWDELKIKNFIRAQTKPYPGAFTIINGKKVTIWDADIQIT